MPARCRRSSARLMPAARVTVQLQGLPLAAGPARLSHYRIDGEHSNSYHQWQLFGSPTAPRTER